LSNAVTTFANYLMNFLPNFKNIKKVQKAAKCLAIFCALSLGIAAIFYSPSKLSSAPITQDCALLDDSVIAEPGKNCLFSAMTPYGSKVLPLCRAIPDITYNIDAANINTAGIRLDSCANLSDLPLCPDQPNSDDKPGKNCVKLCGGSETSHNRNCVRFCDSPEDGFVDSLVPDVNCIARKCHQLSSDIIPVSSGTNQNCAITPCNLLTPKELINVYKKVAQDMEDERAVGRYCENNLDIHNKTLKCYDFNKDQLPYVIKTHMCIMHRCQAPCANYISQIDTNGDGQINAYDHNDTLNISDRNKDGQTDADPSYINTYIATINNNEPLTSTSYCVPTFCRPVIKKQFRCVENTGGDVPTGDSSKDQRRNAQCDDDGDGDETNDCVNSLCFKEIDCNLPINNSGANAKIECSQTTDGSFGLNNDITDAWFYRPKPMNKATIINDGANPIRYLAPMEILSNEGIGDNICYTASQMEDSDDNFEPDINYGGFQPSDKWGYRLIIPGFDIPYIGIRMPPIDFGWFHSSILPDETRSPGICSIKKEDNVGFRGNGYIYLCYGDGNPNAGQLYAKVASHTAYYQGYVRTTFTEGNATHKLNLCLRFRNALRPSDAASETCGLRECAVSCMGIAGGCSQENCGYDVCREFTIYDNPSSDLSTSDTAIIDDYLRLRVQKYSNHICGFLDVKGQTAYDTLPDLFLNGSEKLKDGTCVSGSSGNSANCSGNSSYKDPTLASIWRTIKLGNSGVIPYIQNNQTDRDKNQLPNQPKGYFDARGEFFDEQECINIPLRIPPPRLYNLANTSNSPKLFTPPFYILNALVESGGMVSARGFDGSLGSTDFNYPAVLVNFGNTTQEISLDFNTTGYEPDYRVHTISTSINGIPYSIDAFARKEFNQTSQKPTFCIYRKIVALNGVEQTPERIGCVNRKIPEIDNRILRTMDATLRPQKAVIQLDPASTFNSSKINLRYLAGFGANNIDDNCALGSDDLCSSMVSLENTNASSPTCNSAIVDLNNPINVPAELNVVCAKREECSQLNIECMQNEIDMQAAKVAGRSIDSFLIVRNTCNNHLLPMCNAKKGITANSGTITDTNPSGATPNPKYYGWFNEICIVGDGAKTSSYDSKLKMVLAYKSSPEGFKGKCITQESTTLCPNGGKAPECNCQLADENIAPAPDQEYRKQTHREAGLCVDMPMPQTCPAINYNPTSTIADDPDYIYSSMKLIAATSQPPSTYGRSQSDINDVIHISHRLRSEGQSSGHAEFPIAVLGSIDIEGSCKGFWTNGASAAGFSQPPSRTCLNNNGNAVWSDTIRTPCVRYSCPAISTTGALSEEIGAGYQGNYASSEVGNSKGTRDGFATWPLKLKTTDLIESASAFGCIPGFKKQNSTAVVSGPATKTYETKITSYSGGINPTRKCNQIGIWQTPTNSCERIKCPAITPPSADPRTFAIEDWLKWYDAGGATFPETDASRSIEAGILETGTCNNAIGFFNLGAPPTRRCDHLGNWGPVINPCTTRCDEIIEEFAAGSNNGNATWAETFVTSQETEKAGEFKGCITGYVAYPYPPLKNDYGVSYNLAKGSVTNYINYSSIPNFNFVDGLANFSNSIPLNLADDSRSASNPKKICRTLDYEGTRTNTWGAANSSCINACPGYIDDPRIGVGTTQHNFSDPNQPKVTIKWSNAAFGTWHYFSSTDPDQISQSTAPEFNGQSADSYLQGRSNYKYIIARFCGDGNNGTTKGKWEAPIPQCATNGGIISQGLESSNATYSNSTSGRPASGTVNVEDIATSNSCRSGGIYYPTGSDTTPVAISSYQCVYKDSNQKIDQVYFNKISGQPCQVYCRPPAVDTIFGNSKYTGTPAAPNLTPVGGSLNLGGCAAGYGKALDSDPNTTDNSCGVANVNRGSTPRVTCQSNGVFGNVTNNCTACQSCSANNTASNPNGVRSSYSKGISGCDRNRTLHVSFNNRCVSTALSHTATITCTEHDSDSVSNGFGCNRSWNMYGDFTVKCIDGFLILNSAACRGTCP
jgi:hypothetical protein